MRCFYPHAAQYAFGKHCKFVVCVEHCFGVRADRSISGAQIKHWTSNFLAHGNQ